MWSHREKGKPMENKPCKNCGSYGGNVGCDVCGPPIRERIAKERLALTTCSPCPKCGNDFIELFGGHSGWWVGCKPCSKVDGGPEHFLAESRDSAITKWNAYADPDQANDQGQPRAGKT